MGRRPNPQRKQDLLELIVSYLGDHGVGDMSLRPLAKQLGTSTYTLTYQFGSKDQLLAEAVDFAIARQLGALGAWVAEQPPPSAADLVRRYWAWVARPGNLGLVRMLVEAAALARSQPEIFGEVTRRAVQQWVAILGETLRRAGVDPANAARLATHTHAALVGFQVDLLATGDRERLDAALEDLSQWLETEAAAVATQRG